MSRKTLLKNFSANYAAKILLFFELPIFFVIFLQKKYILLNYILQYQHFSTRISRRLVV